MWTLKSATVHVSLDTFTSKCIRIFNLRIIQKNFEISNKKQKKSSYLPQVEKLVSTKAMRESAVETDLANK